jgi:hypothetical protein
MWSTSEHARELETRRYFRFMSALRRHELSSRQFARRAHASDTAGFRFLFANAEVMSARVKGNELDGVLWI